MPQNPYMDEGFCDTQIWIWDTCFMSLFCKFAQEAFPGVESFKNFYEVLFHGKTLPAVIPTKSEPSWTGATPDVPFNIQVHIADNPPLLAWAEYENALLHGNKEYLKELLYVKKSLQRQYEWLEGLKERKTLPNVNAETCWITEEKGYRWDCGRSGMDNTPRGRTGEKAEKERPNNPDMLWLDALCQQALSAKAIADLFRLVGDTAQADEWDAKYSEKQTLVNDYYWDSEDEFYYDIDCNDKHFYKARTIASYWALTSKIATKHQAKAMLSYLLKDEDFGGQFPLVSLSRKDADFQTSGQYWRGSVWLPTAYATLKGIANYGYYQETQALWHKLFLQMLRTYQEYEPHTIWECYSPTECKPAKQTNNRSDVRPDFCGWSALGPISIYLEYVLGFHHVNAFEKIVEWEKPNVFEGAIGVRNLRFGNIITDIIANETTCTVTSNEA
jgi:glycogen debranching enzyme